MVDRKVNGYRRESIDEKIERKIKKKIQSFSQINTLILLTRKPAQRGKVI